MSRVAVNPDLLTWAMGRSNKAADVFVARFPGLSTWLTGEAQPTFRQLQAFAAATATPFGYFFLATPPAEPLPVPDFRTLNERPVDRPSADLLDTLHTMRRRQDWLRESLVEQGAEPLSMVGAADLSDDPIRVAHEMRAAVGVKEEWAKGVSTWTEAVMQLRRAIEQVGIVAVINGVVGNNTSRKLHVTEFRGFALCDPYAPLIFVNGADAKSAQMFTLVHELAHVWLGEGGISGFEGLHPTGTKIEVFCNKVAAEFLVPATELRSLWKQSSESIERSARHFKVSPVVAARRALDLGLIEREAYFSFYYAYMDRERNEAAKSTGGDFYNNQNTRVGERFAAEVIRAAREGRLLYEDAYQLTGLHGSTFNQYARHLGFDVL